MEIINLDQNTPEWHLFRRCHIGASDAASIIGANPYKNKAKLWDEKVRGINEEENEWMTRGKLLEKEALMKFEQMTGHLCFPVVVIHPKQEWCSASLDGLDVEKKFLLEIKCPGRKNHDIALNGTVPKHYFPQLQHQLFCTELDLAYYFSYDGESGVIIEVNRDDEYIENLLSLEYEFWLTIKDKVTGLWMQ